MGLDMSWYLEPTAEEKTTGLISGEKPEVEEVAYYRKYHELNELLGHFYPDEISDYNCERLYMTEDLLSAMKEWSIDMDPSDENKLRSEVIPTIQTLLSQGREVYYLPWW
jgi:hypothetical protein